MDLLRRAGTAARALGGLARVADALIQLAQQLLQLSHRLHGDQLGAQRATNGVALEVPGHVLANVLHRFALIAVEVGD